MWADHDAVWVSFADNPNGDDLYELELLFGQSLPAVIPEKNMEMRNVIHRRV